MGIVGIILNHGGELYSLMKMKMAIWNAEKQVPGETHWRFCHSLLPKVSKSFALVIQQLSHPEIRNAVCVFYLVLRALDTVEDDTFIPTDVKIPILKAFHHHLYDQSWKFSCGTGSFKVLMDQFHYVRTAFLELNKSYQEVIVGITERMAAGMVKFLHKEVETIDDYDEYCQCVSGLVGVGLSNLFCISGLEKLAPEFLSNSMGLFIQKITIIRDYSEDVNETRFFWPCQIWRKYASKLEDLKYEDNSMSAIQCLNDMVTDALVHVEDCLRYLSAISDQSILRFCAIPQIMAIATLTLCYNNIEVFKGVVKARRGLAAKVFDQTRTMDDVYGAFFDFSCLMKSKVDKNDPNATRTISRLESIQKICRNSGAISRRKSYVMKNELSFDFACVLLFCIILAIVYAYLSTLKSYSFYSTSLTKIAHSK